MCWKYERFVQFLKPLLLPSWDLLMYQWSRLKSIAFRILSKLDQCTPFHFLRNLREFINRKNQANLYLWRGDSMKWHWKNIKNWSQSAMDIPTSCSETYVICKYKQIYVKFIPFITAVLDFIVWIGIANLFTGLLQNEIAKSFVTHHFNLFLRKEY